MGSLPLEGKINNPPPGSLSEAKPCLSPERNLSSLLCKGIYDPKGRGLKPCSPSPCPQPGRQELLSHTLLPPHPSLGTVSPSKRGTSAGLRKSMARSGPLSAARKVPQGEELSQTPFPSLPSPLIVLEGAEPCPALLTPGFSSALNPGAKRENFHLLQRRAKRDVPVRFSFFLSLWLYASGWQAVMEMKKQVWIQRRKKPGLFPPFPEKK